MVSALRTSSSTTEQSATGKQLPNDTHLAHMGSMYTMQVLGMFKVQAPSVCQQHSPKPLLMIPWPSRRHCD
jgi:hypothetical protein